MHQLPKQLRRLFQVQLFRLSIFWLALCFFTTWLPLPGVHVAAAGPDIILQSSTNTLYVDQTFTITASLDATASAHSSTSLELTFDPTLLEATQVNQGNLYYTYDSQNIDNVTGVVGISGNYFGNTLVQNGTFATVTFKTKAAGLASISSANSEIYYNTDQLYVNTYPSAGITINPAESNALLTLTSTFADWALNDSQWISVNLNTQGNQVAGVDAILQYDPTQMQYANASWTELFPYQPTFSVDQEAGRIYISGLTTEGNPINTTAEMLRVQFTTIALGESTFSFDWTEGSTTDTNIASYTHMNTDLLTVAPTPLTITTTGGATLSFSFSLDDFLGQINSVSGTLAVNTETPRQFSNPVASGLVGQVSDFFLGTLSFGNEQDLVIHVPGYLRKKQTSVINFGINPASDYLSFGALRPGDINGDNVINSFDLSNLFGSWNNTYGSKVAQDLNGDNKVNTFDAAILYSYFNQTAALD